MPALIVVDVGALSTADLSAVDTLARLHLTAKRLGVEVQIVNVPRELLELLQLVALDQVLQVEAA